MKNRTKWMMLGLTGLLLAACGTTSQNQETSSASSAISQEKVESTGDDMASIKKNTTDLSQDEVAEIIGVYEDLQQAMIDVDMERLREILPDDYVARHITGVTQTREEWLADIESGEMVYYAFSDVSYELSQSGDQVQLSVSQRITANIYGSQGTWSIPGTRTFEKRDGHWVLVA